MENRRIPKRCYNGSNTESPKTKQTQDKSEIDDTLNVLEKKFDTGSDHIGFVIERSNA